MSNKPLQTFTTLCKPFHPSADHFKPLQSSMVVYRALQRLVEPCRGFQTFAVRSRGLSDLYKTLQSLYKPLDTSTYFNKPLQISVDIYRSLQIQKFVLVGTDLWFVCVWKGLQPDLYKPLQTNMHLYKPLQTSANLTNLYRCLQCLQTSTKLELCGSLYRLMEVYRGLQRSVKVCRCLTNLDRRSQTCANLFTPLQST